jgi:hypothetical protein
MVVAASNGRLKEVQVGKGKGGAKEQIEAMLLDAQEEAMQEVRALSPSTDYLGN